MSRLPLAERFPGVSALPRVELVDMPTPVADGSGIVAAFSAEQPGLGGLWVKRDDLTSRLYGGNKTRKLEFLLGDALERGCKAVITFGAYGSNHALATATHASALGLEPHAVLSPQAPGPFAARTLRAHAGLGTHLHLVDGWDGRREAVTAMRELEQRDGVEPAVIPMGGTSALGALGYVNAAFELLDQVDGGELPPPDRVYVAGGTLGTAVGLAVGFGAAGVATEVVAVRVTPEEVGSDEVARRVAAETIALLRSLDDGFPGLTFDDLRFRLRHDWFEPGYGIATPETLEAVASAAAGSIGLETTYTGKAMAALIGDVRSGSAPRDASVLFWDTYNSAPMPAEGPDELLPQVLRDYVAECDRLFGKA